MTFYGFRVSANPLIRKDNMFMSNRLAADDNPVKLRNFSNDDSFNMIRGEWQVIFKNLGGLL